MNSTTDLGMPVAGDDDSCPASDADPQLPDVPAPVGVTDNCARPTGPVRRTLQRILPLIVGGGILFVAITEGPSLGSTFDALGRVHVTWLLAAIAAETASYAWLTGNLRILAGRPENARRAAPARIALVMFGLGNVLPAAPAEGMAMAGSALRRRRLDPRRAAAMIGFSQWFSLRGLFALASINAVVAVAAGHVPGRYEGGVLLAGLLAIGALIATAWLSSRRRVAEVVASVIIRITHPRDCPPAAERRARGEAWRQVALHVAGGWRRRTALLGSMTMAWLCDGLCLTFALRAVGAHLTLDQVLLAYTAGTLCSNIPLIPAGFGIVETVMPLVLVHYGAAWPTAMAAILLYRLGSTVLPSLAGVGAVLSLRLPVGAPATDAPTVDDMSMASAPGVG